MEDEEKEIDLAIDLIRDELENVLTTLHEQVIWKGNTVGVDDLCFVRELWNASYPRIEKQFRRVALIEGRIQSKDPRFRKVGLI